ncbi:protein phosphatase 2C domain-containing protein [Streptomyces sp. NBC_00503]|uniref:protein phosphatase 2C domain-containing protein n=1 Tax=Streptomyces sp. NBC_00503 TaxID=2903659 RepID=UPI002E8190ED|nr:protein phosphatase 2C domain-containing protein [Streptomyces sp. NBC_00503]WUD84302.1 protein phosphatase 2C domain-containing protein [Streptomyces sp. NBC_00503]
MSQQGAGADDWWHKLYEDPDAGPETDPRDTLDHRFRSAAVMVAPPVSGEGAILPGQRRDPARPDRPTGEEQAPPQVAAEPVVTEPTAPEPVVAEPVAPEPVAPPPVVPEPVVPEPVAPQAWSPAEGAYGESLLPPPRDPRAGGQTWYALGDVSVPPALPAEGPAGAEPDELPVWSWGAPGDEGPRGDEPGPAPAVEPGPAAPQPAGRAPVRPAAAGTETAVAGTAAAAGAAKDPAPAVLAERPVTAHLGDRPPTYAPEPVALPTADPAALSALTPDTVLEGAQYGGYTLRAASLRGDSARFRGEPRRDFLLTARFGAGPDALVLVVLAGGDRAAPGAAAAAAELCRSVAGAVGRSQERLAEDIRAGRREALRSGLQRLTDRGYGRLRARSAELGLAEEAYTAGLRGLLLPVDPECRTRISFGAGAGGLFRLRAGEWSDLEEAPASDTGFRFRGSVARPGDTLLLCSGGLAEPMREEKVLCAELAARWSDEPPPGLAAFLADTQLRLKGYADDRTAAAVWEA